MYSDNETKNCLIWRHFRKTR